MSPGKGRSGMFQAAAAIFDESSEGAGGRAAAMLLGLALAGAIALRLYLLLAMDFPINDGGLFLEFIRSIADSFPGIPESVVYNGFSIPFAYPPLSFWTAALLTKLGFDALGVVRVLPILMNIIYALLFALLLVRSGQARIATALALVFFLVSTRSYEWLVMGGGISRGFGSIFLLLALLAVGIPGSERRPPLSTLRLALCGAAVGGAILSHLEWGLLATASVVVALALGYRTFRDLVRSCLITGATAFVLVAPWIAAVLAEHGLQPFLAAGQTSQSGFLNSLEQFLWLVRTNIFNIFIALGGAALLWRRQFFWIAFFLLCVFVTPRHGPTPIVLPLCVFVGEGVVVAFRLFRLVIRSRTAAVAAAGVVFTTVLVAQVVEESEERAQVVRSLSAEQRQAMAWVQQKLPGARFALLSPLIWQADRAAEWFPVLTRATSTTTVQGREWLPDGAFRKSEEKVLALKASKSCPELHRGLAAFEPPQFVWAETMKQCFAAPAYMPMFSNPEVTIFRANATGRGGA